MAEARVNKIIDRLNLALKEDRGAMTSLFRINVTCNDYLCSDKYIKPEIVREADTTQVDANQAHIEALGRLNLLTLINGLMDLELGMILRDGLVREFVDLSGKE